MKPLETERLSLRPFVLEDAEALHREIYSDLEVVRQYSGKGVLTLEQTRQHLADPPFNALEVELAFAFGRRSWGKSIAYEACLAMIRYAFGDLRLRRLVGGAMTDNLRSVNLHRRLGYRIERNLAPSTDPRWADSGWVTILENDRLAASAPPAPT